MDLSRRRLLGCCLTGGIALAGCTGSEPATDSDDSDGTEGPMVGDVELDSSFPIEIYDGETRVAQIHWHGQLRNSHWHQQPMTVPQGRWKAHDVRVNDTSGDPIPLGDGRMALSITPTEETQDDLIDFRISGRQLETYGQKPGLGEYRLDVVDGDQVLWPAPLLRIEVA
jgi:hypothetical protein